MARTKQEKSDFENTLAELEKKYGMRSTISEKYTITSTGSVQLDKAMRIGGTPLGKIIEIFGPESSGKTTVTLHQIAEYQKAFPERRVALFDYEHSFDPSYAKAIGVDVDKLLIYQPDNQESGYDMILALIEKDLVSCIVIDSQTAAAPKAVIDGEMGDSTIALQARNNSKFCLKVKGLLSVHRTTLFIISQTRDNIGAMAGDPTITTGGKAIKFYADVRWKIWKMNDKDNELNKTTIDVVKSKVGKPFGQAKIAILWGKGFDKLGEIINYALEFGFIIRAGAWYSYGDTKLGQGTSSVRELMIDNPEFLKEIKDRVMEALMEPPTLSELEEQNEEV